MATLATRPFWLDGDYDRDSVEACPHYPVHRWWTFRLGDVIEPERLRDPDELMVICTGCYVPRLWALDGGQSLRAAAPPRRQPCPRTAIVTYLLLAVVLLVYLVVVP